jgi:ArsR family transcriptional regulator
MTASLRDLSHVFKALADPTRIRMVGLLLGGAVCVCDIHQSLGIPQSKASRHLAYLRRTGLVEAEKRGLWVYYRLAPQKEAIAQALVDAARHCIGHLPDARKDAARLEKKTGCSVPVPGAVTVDCCGVPSRPPS